MIPERIIFVNRDVTVNWETSPSCCLYSANILATHWPMNVELHWRVWHCVFRSCCRWCRNLVAVRSCTVNWPIRRQLLVSTSVWRTRSTTSSRSCCTRRTVSTRHLKTVARFVTPTVFLLFFFWCKNLLNASLTFAWTFISVIFHFLIFLTGLIWLHLWNVYSSDPSSTVNLYSFQPPPAPTAICTDKFLKTCNVVALGPIHFFHAYLSILLRLFFNFTRRFGNRLNFVLTTAIVLSTDLVIFIYRQWRLRRLNPN